MDGGDATSPWVHKEVTEGEWAGWKIWSSDPFELYAGPFYARADESGQMVCAFRAERKHMNGGGFMHGGCMMTFADYALFAIAQSVLGEGHAVTVSFSSDFVGPAHPGDLVEATGEVVKAGKSMVFIRGLITTGGETMMSFSGVIKKVGRRL